MIACIGTTPAAQRTMVFDRVIIDAVNRAVHVHDYASGKSINVARVLHTLGREVVACGFAGGDRGQFLCRDLDRTGIRHEFVTVAAPTRQCITVIDRSAGTATELVEESHPVTERDWDALDAKLRELLPAAKVLVFSGTLAPGGTSDFYARWIVPATNARAQVIVDARGEPLRAAMRHEWFLVKVNREEFAATVGIIAGSLGELARHVVRHVPAGGGIVVTLGAEGALCSDGRTCWKIQLPPVKAVSAVGSGDAFAAGLAAGLHDGWQLVDACRLGAACGAANALTPYAGHVDLKEVERLTGQVSVEVIRS